MSSVLKHVGVLTIYKILLIYIYVYVCVCVYVCVVNLLVWIINAIINLHLNFELNFRVIYLLKKGYIRLYSNSIMRPNNSWYF